MKKLTWYHELGFYSNPFSIKPAAFHNDLFGYDILIDKLNEQVYNSNILFIHGAYGTGKTTILKKIINEFRGKRKVIYYNCNKHEGSIDFDGLLIGAGNFFSRLFKIKKKNMIMLLDEAQDLNKKDMDNVKTYFEQDFFRSVIFVSKKEDIFLPVGIKKIIGKNYYDLNNISQDEAVTMIRKRIGDLQFLSDEMIIRIFKRNKNPRAFLKNCEDVCRNTFNDGAEKVTSKDVANFI